MDIDRTVSELVTDVLAGIQSHGRVRLNLSALLTDTKAGFMIKAVDHLARNTDVYLTASLADTAGGRFVPKPEILNVT